MFKKRSDSAEQLLKEEARAHIQEQLQKRAGYRRGYSERHQSSIQDPAVRERITNMFVLEIIS